MKTCSACQEAKPLDEFYRHPSTKDRRQSRCKACSKQQATEWRRANPERWKVLSRRGRIFWRYGLRHEDYKRMLEGQGGGCAICGVQPTVGEHLAIDHCHKTDKVRGLLCSNCNAALGYLKDKPTRARAAADYLESHS